VHVQEKSFGFQKKKYKKLNKLNLMLSDVAGVHSHFFNGFNELYLSQLDEIFTMIDYYKLTVNWK